MPNAYITVLKNVRAHSNADKLLLADCFGMQVIVPIWSKEGDMVVYFPTDTQVSEKYATDNNLLKSLGGYLKDTRHIRSLRLRGENSDGLAMPISTLSEYTDVNTLQIGDCVDVINGVEIARKYVPKVIYATTSHSKKSKSRVSKYPLFMEHVDTKQLAYNLGQFKEGDVVTISLKMHGTSQRSANTLKVETRERTLKNRLLCKLGLTEPFIKEWNKAVGTRRMVLEGWDGGFYKDDSFRRSHHEKASKGLMKGETIYYEVVGYASTDKPIMGSVNNNKVGDKQFSKKYGETTAYTYGCENGESDMYAYRMTMTNEDGEVVEYPTWLLEERCEKMNVKTVPVLDRFIFTTEEDLMERVGRFVDGEDPVGKTHIREGVVVRIENRPTFSAYKQKNFYFKVLEGLIKDEGIVDIEEEESIQ